VEYGVAVRRYTGMTNSETVFVLRVVKPDMTSRGSDEYNPNLNPFKWPESGPVECPDWIDNDRCGNGLHGWLWGAGDLTGNCSYWNLKGAKWLVVEVKAADIRKLDGKIKYPRGNVVFCGLRDEAVKFITERAPAGTPIIFGTATAGEGGTATAGYAGTATAGDRGTATAGYAGTATAGEGGTATAGEGGTATAGDRGTATAGYAGTATAGDRGTATAGDRGTATAGDRGTATAGYAGTATAGYAGTATAGYAGTATAGEGGTATAGEGGVITLLKWNSKLARYSRVIGEIGEAGLKPGIAYILDADGKFMEKK